jgi:hypothetical protein
MAAELMRAEERMIEGQKSMSFLFFSSLALKFSFRTFAAYFWEGTGLRAVLPASRTSCASLPFALRRSFHFSFSIFVPWPPGASLVSGSLPRSPRPPASLCPSDLGLIFRAPSPVVRQFICDPPKRFC